MVYQFRNEEGALIERRLSIHDDIPAEVTENGTVYRRVFNVPNVTYGSFGFNKTDLNVNTVDGRIDEWRRKHLD